MDCEKNRANPMVAPIFNPKEREMIKYSPPPSTRLLVASSEIARAVGIVTRCPNKIIRITPQKPSVPTAKPNRRNRMAPRMVEIAVKKTGAVPNFFVFMLKIFQSVNSAERYKMKNKKIPSLKKT